MYLKVEETLCMAPTGGRHGFCYICLRVSTTMEIVFEKTFREEDLPTLSRELLDRFGDHSVWAFYAGMGVGKTTLIKELSTALGVEETTSSPTFAIVNEYHSPKGSIYHFDCYRLETLADAYSIGTEEYLDSGHYCFIEWPEVLEILLPEDTVRVMMESVNSDTREIKVSLK